MEKEEIMLLEKNLFLKRYESRLHSNNNIINKLIFKK